MKVFNKIVPLLLSLILYISNTNAQAPSLQSSKRILEDSTFAFQMHPAFENFILNIVVSEITRENEYPDEFITYDVTVHSVKNDSLIQTFTDTVFVGEHSFEYWLTDVNFDSFTDIAFAQEEGGSGYNRMYHFWVYDKEKESFILNKEFSILSNPEVDTTSKTIFESNFGGLTDQSRVYILQDNKLVCIEFNEIERILDEANGKYYQVSSWN